MIQQIQATHTYPYYNNPQYAQTPHPQYICATCQLPTKDRNYCIFDKGEIDYFVKQKEQALPYLTDILTHSNNEAQITEVLYILNRMADDKTKEIDKLYPVLAKFNNTKSPNIQTYLAGIYRKTQVPDAFGPLVKMLIRNSLQPDNPNQAFDPNEEIGGAILSYLSDRFRSDNKN